MTKRWEKVGIGALFAVMLTGALISIWTYDWRPAATGAVIAILTSTALMCAQTPS